MTEQNQRTKIVVQRILIVAILLLGLSGGAVYYRISTQPSVDSYISEKSQESTLRMQLQSLESQNAQRVDTIEQTGKELVSFSEDKIKYINLASSLSEEHNVTVDKLTVSDVWTEGQMAGMTTQIEIEGTLANIRNFVNAYCSTKYANRVNTVSFRPTDRFAWVSRELDGSKVIEWFDLTDEEEIYREYLKNEIQARKDAAAAAGLRPADVGLDISGNASIEDMELALGISRRLLDEVKTSTSSQPQATQTSSVTMNSSKDLLGEQDSMNIQSLFYTPGLNSSASQLASNNDGYRISLLTGPSTDLPDLSAIPADDVGDTEVTPTDDDSAKEDSEDSDFDFDTTTVTPHPDSTIRPNNWNNPWAGEPTQEWEEGTPISLARMFSPKIYKVYLEIDFLGRQ